MKNDSASFDVAHDRPDEHQRDRSGPRLLIPTKASIPILMYHHIALPPAGALPSRGLFVSPRRFRSQMTAMKRLGYRGCSVTEALRCLQLGDAGKIFAITFDDGYEDVYANALPVLDACGFTATTYFVSRQVGGFNQWDVELGVAASPCMNGRQLREWKALGHEVGGHTANHRRLGTLTSADARAEIAGCRRALEDRCGSPVDAFSYPYGSFNQNTPALVEEAGYANAVTTQKRRVSASDDPFCLPRFNVRRQDVLGAFLWKSLFRRT